MKKFSFIGGMLSFLMFVSCTLGGVVCASREVDSQEPFLSATGMIERFHKQTTTLTADETSFASQALRSRPESIGFVASAQFPIRSHYPSDEFLARAEQIMLIVEESWDKQVLEWGFTAPPPDCGSGGSDDLDIYIQSLPAGVGGYAAFSCYVESTPQADAASFIVVSDALSDSFLRSAVTHEFNHVLQNAMDYWENITFKENTATWVMDWMYDEDNQYVSYLRPYQKNPDWPLHKFSSTTTYQYGGCILLHFLSEYYAGGDPSIVVDIWKSCIQNEHRNEPDFLDALAAVIPVVSGGMDTLEDALAEYSVWRTITAGRDDGVHFHDGGIWPAAAEIAFDTVVDFDQNPDYPIVITPEKAPYDFGFSYVKLLNPQQIDTPVSIEFSGDPTVKWSVVLIHCRDIFETQFIRRMDLQNGWGIQLLNLGLLQRADEILIGIVNLSDNEFDPDDGSDGVRRSYSLTIRPVVANTSLDIWVNQPITAPGMTYTLNVDLEIHSQIAPTEFWLFLEMADTFFSAFTGPQGEPVALTIPASQELSLSAPVIQFPMQELPGNFFIRWHAGLLSSGVLIDYATARSNLANFWERSQL